MSLNLSNLLFSTDVSLGTLWRVKESVWKDQLPTFYISKKSKKMHPGLSILNDEDKSSCKIVPLLHGTSCSKGPVVVKGFSNDSEKYGENHKSSFGKILRPARIPKKKMEEYDLSNSFFKSDLGPMWYLEFDVMPNRHKPRVSIDEKEKLDLFLKRKMAEDE
jgi:hypothetical protein